MFYRGREQKDMSSIHTSCRERQRERRKDIENEAGLENFIVYRGGVAVRVIGGRVL